MNLHDHPLRREHRPNILIRPGDRLALALATALEFGRPSLRAIGHARAGKSTADELLADLRGWRPFNVGFLRTIAGNPERHTESALFRDIALGLKLRQPKNSTGTDALLRIARAIEEEAGRANASTVILSIDNAELLQLEDYNHLVRLHTMFAKDLRLFFLFICQTDARPEGCEMLEALAPPHIRGRFFLDRHHVTGLLWAIPEQDKAEQDTNDVALALRVYDRELRWPEDSGPFYTEAFAPKAYAEGWRLEQQLDDIRHEIEVLCAAENLLFMPDWLMASFEPFIYYILVRVAGSDPNFSKLSRDHVRDGLRASAFIEFEKARQGVRR